MPAGITENTTYMKKSVKTALISLMMFVAAVALVFGIAFSVLAIKTNTLQHDYSFVYRDERYAKEVYIEGIEPITQSISCGYAVIEMFSTWNGGNITEEDLYTEYGKVVTSTGKSFCGEFNKQFPEYEPQMFKYLKNSELIVKVSLMVSLFLLNGRHFMRMNGRCITLL